jgi:hypothetical protein
VSFLYKGLEDYEGMKEKHKKPGEKNVKLEGGGDKV